MKKLLVFIFISILLSCNASILMTNGEITQPGTGSSSSGERSDFSGSAPRSVNATKSYYADRIIVTWSSVEGADYYTIERAMHDSPSVSANAEWKRLDETVTECHYTDTFGLCTGRYYSYRITAHSFEGEEGEVSAASTGTILSSPSTISVSKGTSSATIDIEWEQMPNVESYRIYKSDQMAISGLDVEHIATVQANDSGYNGFSYSIDQSKEMGKELYFAIEGVGPTGERADISLPRSGYTFIPGAPLAPEIASITKGDSLDSISIRFRSNGSGVKYIVKKHFPGSSESIFFSEDYGNVLPEPDAEGFYTLVDSDVMQNTEYTYSVIAYNELGFSQASVAVGYLLSPARDARLVAAERNGSIGYELEFAMPAGGSDSSRSLDYIYIIDVYEKSGDRSEAWSIETDDLSSCDFFYPVSRDVDSESEKREARYAEIKVKAGVNVSQPVRTNQIGDLQQPVYSITATRNDRPLDGESPNINGVYPVTVRWESDYSGERNLIRTGSDGSTRTFRIASGNEFRDDTCDILVKYDYCFDTSDEFGRTLGSIQHAEGSYASISDQAFIDLFESLSLKPWENQAYVPAEYRQYWKKSRIATLVGYGNASDLNTQMKALDSTSDHDHFRNGEVTYSAAMEGVGGQIYFTYKDFGESRFFYINGNYEMHVNASGTGSAASNTGGFDVRGMYPGHVGLESISVSKKAFTGSYTVRYEYGSGETRDFMVEAK